VKVERLTEDGESLVGVLFDAFEECETIKETVFIRGDGVKSCPRITMNRTCSRFSELIQVPQYADHGSFLVIRVCSHKIVCSFNSSQE
jgi:hypothetical protein